METREGECRNCGITDWFQMGFVPAEVFSETDAKGYVDAEVCSSCGTTRINHPSQEEVDEAIDEYLDILEEHELVSESEIEMMRE